jgi:uncharacterized protein DUF3576
MSVRIVACVVAAALSVTACGMFGGSKSGTGDTQTQTTTNDPYHTDPGKMDPRDFNPKIQSDQDPSTFSLMANLFGGGSKDQNSGGGAGVGVNSFLWRASLDTVSFMPLASADPFGGVIISDWYSPPDTPDERFKVNVFILGRDLRADGVRASVFHQKKDASGQWTEAPVDANTATDLENAILTRARQIRLSAVANEQ